MRVACVGNSNHIFLSLVRFLRDRGVRADLLLVDDEVEHFHPSHDSLDDDYRAYTVRLDWGSAASFYRTTARRVRRDLAAYDVIIGCGFVPAFCEKIGRRLDIFVPYGADLYYFPFGLSKARWVKRVGASYVSRKQRRGIQHARRIHCLDFYAPYRQALERLGVEYQRVACTPIYYPQYDRITEPAIRAQLRHAAAFDALRERYAFVLQSHSRQYWRRSMALGRGRGKGNDVLIEGFAHYLRESGRTDVGLVLFELGDDVRASRDLVRSLGIGERVHWLPQMSRKELMYGVARCDAGADQFPDADDNGAYGGTAIELMSLGKPTFARLFYTPDQFRDQIGFPMPPLVNVLSPKELAPALAELVESPARLAASGSASRDWAREHYGTALIDHYVELL